MTQRSKKLDPQNPKPVRVSSLGEREGGREEDLIPGLCLSVDGSFANCRIWDWMLPFASDSPSLTSRPFIPCETAAWKESCACLPAITAIIIHSPFCKMFWFAIPEAQEFSFLLPQRVPTHSFLLPPIPIDHTTSLESTHSLLVLVEIENQLGLAVSAHLNSCYWGVFLLDELLGSSPDCQRKNDQQQ